MASWSNAFYLKITFHVQYVNQRNFLENYHKTCQNHQNPTNGLPTENFRPHQKVSVDKQKI